jgi:Family of unknown function (DUF6492)
MGMLSGVMALKITGRHYPDNIGRCDILFESLRHFGLAHLFSEFLIVVPRAEEAKIRNYARAWSDFPLELVVEDEYLALFKKFNKLHEVRPWHRQQIIKLFCASLVANPYFLVVDPDLFAVRGFRYDDVMPGGKALLQPESREVHKQWWLDSAELLGVEAHLERTGMGVTPAILSKEACRGLTEHLEKRHGRVWYEVLLSRYAVDWTEYTLYALYLESSGRLDDLHVWPKAGARVSLHSIINVWSDDDFDKVDLAALFGPENPGVFAVIQSNTGVTPQRIATAIRPYLNTSIQNYERSNSVREKVMELYGAGIRKTMRLLRVRA